MRRYRSVRQRVIDEVGEEVCACRDDATALMLADALNDADRPPHVRGSLLVGPDRMEGVTVERPTASLLDEPSDTLAELLLEGEDGKSQLCRRAGGTLSAPEVASLLRLSSDEIERRRCEAQLLAVKFFDDEFRYPVCQFIAELAPGAAEILEIVGAEEWTALEFMSTSIPELGGDTGLEAFASSDPAKRELARRVAQIAAGERMD